MFNVNELIPNLENTYYFVEADSFATYALWVMYVSRPYPGTEPVKWEEINRVFFHKHRETLISFRFAYIHDKLVCFYAPDSKIANWKNAKEFLKPYIHKNKTNSMNFYNCVINCKK